MVRIGHSFVASHSLSTLKIATNFDHDVTTKMFRSSTTMRSCMCMRHNVLLGQSLLYFLDLRSYVIATSVTRSDTIRMELTFLSFFVRIWRRVVNLPRGDHLLPLHELDDRNPPLQLGDGGSLDIRPADGLL
jgi:hypothetical protein